MAKYKVIVTARSFGKTDSKARELLEEDGCSVIKLEEADGPIYEQLKNELRSAYRYPLLFISSFVRISVVYV